MIDSAHHRYARVCQTLFLLAFPLGACSSSKATSNGSGGTFDGQWQLSGSTAIVTFQQEGVVLTGPITDDPGYVQSFDCTVSGSTATGTLTRRNPANCTTVVAVTLTLAASGSSFSEDITGSDGRCDLTTTFQDVSQWTRTGSGSSSSGTSGVGSGSGGGSCYGPAFRVDHPADPGISGCGTELQCGSEVGGQGQTVPDCCPSGNECYVTPDGAGKCVSRTAIMCGSPFTYFQGEYYIYDCETGYECTPGSEVGSSAPFVCCPAGQSCGATACAQ